MEDINYKSTSISLSSTTESSTSEITLNSTKMTNFETISKVFTPTKYIPKKLKESEYFFIYIVLNQTSYISLFHLELY